MISYKKGKRNPPSNLMLFFSKPLMYLQVLRKDETSLYFSCFVTVNAHIVNIFPHGRNGIYTVYTTDDDDLSMDNSSLISLYLIIFYFIKTYLYRMVH